MSQTRKLSDHPNAEFTKGMLKEAILKLEPRLKPIIHNDQGMYDRWEFKIELMKNACLTRSISQKACFPDKTMLPVKSFLVDSNVKCIRSALGIK